MLKEVLLESQMKNTRLLIALSSITWAILLAWPGTLFERPTYHFMSMIASENVWAMLFLLHGWFSLIALKSKTLNRLTLIFDAWFGCILWTVSTAACFTSHWPFDMQVAFIDKLAIYDPPAAMSGELWVSIFSWWYVIRHWAGEKCEPNRPCY